LSEADGILIKVVQLALFILYFCTT